jgi:hypothetical protein
MKVGKVVTGEPLPIVQIHSATDSALSTSSDYDESLNRYTVLLTASDPAFVFYKLRHEPRHDFTLFVFSYKPISPRSITLGTPEAGRRQMKADDAHLVGSQPVQ